jgi:hypothetical protein
MKTLLLSIRLTLLTIVFIAMTTSTFAQCSVFVLSQPTCVDSCNGSAAANRVNGTPPYTYLWNPSGQTTEIASGLCAGNYTCTITDANSDTCSSSIVIPSPTPVVAVVDTESTTCPTCCDGSIHVACSGGALPCRFNLNGTTFQYGGDFYNVCPGSHTLCIEDAYGCITCSLLVINSLTTDVEKIQDGSSINITPNPFFTQLTITHSTTEPTSIILSNICAQQILQQTFINSTTINTEHLADGIYFYELRNEKGMVRKGKVIKQ